MGTPLHSFAHGAWQALTGKSTVHYSDLGSFESRDIRTLIAKLKIRHAEFIQAGIKALENRKFPIACHQVNSQKFQDKWATLISVALEHYLRNLRSPADHPKKDFKDELDDMRQTLDARSPPGTNYQHNSILYLARQLTGQTQLAHASTRASKKSKKTSTENITKRMVQALAILGATGTMLWLAKECYKVKLLPQAQNAAKLELIARAEDERLAKGTVNDVVLPGDTVDVERVSSVFSGIALVHGLFHGMVKPYGRRRQMEGGHAAWRDNNDWWENERLHSEDWRLGGGWHREREQSGRWHWERGPERWWY